MNFFIDSIDFDCSISELVKIVKKTDWLWNGFSEWITSENKAVIRTKGRDSLYSSAMYMFSKFDAVSSCESWKVWIRARAISVARTA